jgi:tetratricopeptide (TPR) repeat protein
MFALCLGVARPAFAAPDSPAALSAAKSCKEQLDLAACKRGIRLGLSPKLASEVYTVWVDGGYGRVPDARGVPDAATTLRKAIKLDPQNALAIYLLSTCVGSMNSKQIEEQEKLLRRVIELRPDWDAPHARLASLLGPFRYQESIREWQQAAKLAPDDPIYIAQTDSLKKQYEEGQAKLAEMEAKAKEDPKSWAIQAAYAAKFVCDLGKVEIYFAEFQKYFSDTPPILLADSCAACGQEERARKLYGEIVAGFEKRLNSGLSYNDALQLQDNALQSMGMIPEMIRLRLLQATLAEREKNWIAAGSILERVSWDAPSAEVFARLANAEIKAGRMQGDIQSVVQKAAKLDASILERHPELKPYYKPEPKR